eukprot:CAMPEP_0115138526 /NCGR_PEP_ID=MMETSP0227-20121206/57722_1 /TAXON_ID=89957 /ORGANISM="Polarella glacialis, Strain CCMP 1383" /LENGTH=148 /DNA_ID=CAMNT_0002546169 /DNA_START=27 /DNA_END=470 /DNA_ORIENTATION=+
MVEGHGVHRSAFQHRRKLLGRRFYAVSPSGRFKEGAAAISGRVLVRVEVHGKELFHFWSKPGGSGETAADDLVVVRIHFGMSGRFLTTAGASLLSEATDKTRLRLMELPASGGEEVPGDELEGLVLQEGCAAQVSAQVCEHGGLELYE